MGCISYVLLFGLIAGAAMFTWSWLHRERTATLITPDDRLNAAAGAFVRGELQSAISLARPTVDAGPRVSPERYVYAVMLLTRALIFQSYADYDKAPLREAALRVTQTAHQRLPTNPDISAVYAYALAVNGFAGDAAEAANAVLANHPDAALARTALALAYSRVGRHDLALGQSLQAVDDAAGDQQIEALRALAIALNDNGDYAGSIRAIEGAIRVNPTLVPLYFERALYAMQTGDADSATVAYYQILTLDPANAKGHLRLCELSSMLREHEAAVRYCTAVTELAPVWSDGWYQLGREYFLNGEFALAQEHLHQCSSLQVRQNVPIGDRRFACWYLQGQAAQLVGDCAGLVTTYLEFRQMASQEDLTETWVYPPDGPPGCTDYMPSFRPAFEPTAVR